MKSSVAITTILATATLAAPLSWCEKGGKVVDCNKMYNPKCSLGGKVIDCDNMAEGESNLFRLPGAMIVCILKSARDEERSGGQ